MRVLDERTPLFSVRGGFEKNCRVAGLDSSQFLTITARLYYIDLFYRLSSKRPTTDDMTVFGF